MGFLVKKRRSREKKKGKKAFILLNVSRIHSEMTTFNFYKVKNMMVKRLLLLFCFFGSLLGLQAQNRVNQVMEIFVEDYNTSNYDKFYHRFSESLQSRVPFNTVESFFDEMKQNLGSIVKMEYYGLNDDQTPLFKTQFEKDTAIVNFAFDEDANIVGFRILDYVNQDDLRQGLAEKTVEDIILDNATFLPEQGELALAIIKGN